MRLLVKFKDGMVMATQEFNDTATFTGNMNIFEFLRNAKNNPDAIVNLNDKIERKFCEVYSVEIVLD